jgi:hypothetical protein
VPIVNPILTSDLQICIRATKYHKLRIRKLRHQPLVVSK